MSTIPPWLDTAIDRAKRGPAPAGVSEFSHGPGLTPPGPAGDPAQSDLAMRPAVEPNIGVGSIPMRRPRWGG